MNQLDLVLCDRPVRGSTTEQRLKIPCCASTQFQKSFAARTITEWNSLPDSRLASVSEAICLLHHAHMRAHSIAEISARRFSIIIQIQLNNL